MGVFMHELEKKMWDNLIQDSISAIMFGSPTKVEKEEEIFPIAYIEVDGKEIAAAVSKDLQKAFELNDPYIKSDREILTFTFKRWFRGMDF
jgi:hypothetical protein